MPNGRENLSVTVAIVTRDRKDELRRALQSVLAQDAQAELLVVDDGSVDGTSEMVRDEFPSARLHRYESPRGMVVGRNHANELAATDIVMWLDDDAYLPSPATVSQTIADFEHPRVGIVAVPFADVTDEKREERHSKAPDDRVWVLPTFMGAVHAVRKTAFDQVGGYKTEYFMYGEERDLCLRLLAAGYVTRMGRADAGVHVYSAVRSLEKMDLLGRRNEIIWAWSSFPPPWHLVYIAGYSLKGVLWGLRFRRLRRMVRGVARGLRAIPSFERAPVPREAFALDRRLRKQPLPLGEFEAELPPLSLPESSAPAA
jgi:GT2 family glycosyltransferase